MNYIGIKGHRGAGKSSISYLIGNTIEYMYIHQHENIWDDDRFDSCYATWCNQLMISENCINEASLQYVYFDSFSDSIKAFIRLLLGCPEEYVYEDKYKDLVIINLKDLSYKLLRDFNNMPNLRSANEVYSIMPYESEKSPNKIINDIYMTLREFIMYYGYEVMQRFFGKNVWVKVLQATNSQFDAFFKMAGGYYKIYYDLKTQAECDFIKKQNGVIVNIIRPQNKKGKSKLITQDDTSDYTIIVDGDLLSIKQEIINISKQINNNFKYKHEENQENDGVKPNENSKS